VLRPTSSTLRRLIDHAPARCVEKIRGRLHAAERIGIDQLLGFRRQRAVRATKSACGSSALRSDIAREQWTYPLPSKRQSGSKGEHSGLVRVPDQPSRSS